MLSIFFYTFCTQFGDLCTSHEHEMIYSLLYYRSPIFQKIFENISFHSQHHPYSKRVGSPAAALSFWWTWWVETSEEWKMGAAHSFINYIPEFILVLYKQLIQTQFNWFRAAVPPTFLCAWFSFLQGHRHHRPHTSSIA